MRIERQYGEEQLILHVEQEGGGWRVRLPDGSEQYFTASRQADGILQIAAISMADMAGFSADSPARMFRVPFATSGENIAFAFAGETYTFHAQPRRASGRKPGNVSGQLNAAMSGVVSEVLVSVGQQVAARQPLVVLEAMKVMTTLEAPFAGTVASLSVHPNQQIVQGAPVVEIKQGEQ